jgi:Protein of unknown function (DUF1553)/Protein of unknown function (DUF1549)
MVQSIPDFRFCFLPKYPYLWYNRRMKRSLWWLSPMVLLGVVSVGSSAQKSAPTPLFLRDVAPILDKKGCSVAACHGKFGGRGGLQLSLLTLSPEDDYDPLVRGGRGRRVNFVEPQKSLLLQKATNAIGHMGGERFKVGSPEYNTMLRWIAAGAPYDAKNDPKLATLTVTPAKVVLSSVGAKTSLKVIAEFTDGTKQDVTSEANYESSDTAVVEVNEKGVVTGKRWGGTGVVVRYLGTVQAAFFTLPRADSAAYPKLTSNNYIDEKVYNQLKQMNVVPSRLTTDAEFLRRVSLDLRGILPTDTEISKFIEDKAANKRNAIIGNYLESPEFVDVRTLRLSDMLRIHPRNIGGNIQGERGAALFTEFVRDAVAENMPYDQFVKKILTIRGNTVQNGATNFYRIERSSEGRMETVAQAFLGQRMACARCHKHPFDRWTTDNYWNFAAFFGKVGVKGTDIENENEIFYAPNANVINQSVTGKKGQVAPPTFLGDSKPLDITSTVASLQPQILSNNYVDRLANWCVAPKNPYFAKATVNRLWSHYLGRGVMHPVDDMRATTPPAVPGLLDAMATDFVAHGYDMKYMIRTIMQSKTYQTSSEVNATNALDNQFFSRFYPRAMMGPVLLDVMNQATGTKEQFGDFPLETRVAQLNLPINSYFLDTFGRSHREFLANLEPKVEPTLIQTLHILNSPYIENKVRNGGGTVASLLADKAQTDESVIKSLYRRTFSRDPSPQELASTLAYFKSAPNRAEAAQDLMWALISAREFYFVS